MYAHTVGSFAKAIKTNQEKATVPITEARSFYTPEMTEIIDGLSDISSMINIVEMVTPTNHATERDAWLEEARQNRFVEPNFQYDKDLLARIITMRPKFREIKIKADGLIHNELGNSANSAQKLTLFYMLRNRVLAVEKALDFAHQIYTGNHQALRGSAQAIYGTPTTIDMAHRYVEELNRGGGKETASDTSHVEIGNKLKEVRIDAQGIKRAFIWAAEQCGFSKTRPVLVMPKASSIDVRDTSSDGPMVVIPEDKLISGMRLLELVGHEVLCHWRDSENAQILLPGFGGGALKAYDEAIYEGHAVTCDYQTCLKYTGEAAKLAQPYYVIAESLAKEGLAFPTVADEIYRLKPQTGNTEHTVLSKTWLITYRAFRGSNGQNNIQRRYAFSKDRAYFEGRLLARELIDAGLGHLLDLGTLGEKDLSMITAAFKVEPKDFTYGFPEDILDTLADKIIAGDFTAIQ